jgi:hypothetical protein
METGFIGGPYHKIKLDAQGFTPVACAGFSAEFERAVYEWIFVDCGARVGDSCAVQCAFRS